MASPRLFSGLIVFGLISGYGMSKLCMGAGLIDDSYIFFRYAENFGNGYGLVFNPGERVEGYSSPLWVGLLGVLAWLNLDVVLAAKVLSAALGAATLLTLRWLCAKFVPARSEALVLIPCWFLATTPAFVFWTWAAMDTALFTFLFFLVFALFFRISIETSRSEELTNGGKPTRFDGLINFLGLGFCFTLAALTRLEILAILPVYLFFIFYLDHQNGFVLLKKYLLFLAPLSLLPAHLWWRYSFYEAWLPNTYYAKTADIPRLLLWQNGFNYTLDFLKVYGVFVAVGLVFPAIIWSRVRPDIWKLSAVIIMVWVGVVTYVGGDHFSLFRFYVPVLPVIGFLLIFAVRWLVGALKCPYWGLSVVLILMITGLNGAIYVYGGGERARNEVETAQRWVEVGRWMEENLPADATIASVVVGAIPYYSGLITYDLAGLTDREVARHGRIYLEGRVGHQKYNTDYILARRPDYIISPASGLFNKPVGAGLDKRYNYSLYNLITNPQTLQWYEYRTISLDNHTFVEFLRLKDNQ